MSLRPLRLFLCLFLLPWLAAPVLAQDGEHAEAKQQAQEVAEQWLELTDAGQFGQSWDEGATLMQEQISREAWIERGTQAKETLQALRSRQFSRAQYRDSLQQAPSDGPFVLLEYRSEFETGLFEEVILAVKEGDTWKVGGYQVAPLRHANAPADTSR